MSESPIEFPPGPAIDLEAFVDHGNDTTTQPQEPPRRERIGERVKSQPAPAKPQIKEPASKPGEFVEPLEEMYALAGLGVSMFDSDGICGNALAQSAHGAAVAWDELAQKNPGVRRSLRKLTQGSAWAGVFAAHMPIAIAIASAHMPREGMPGPLRVMADNAEQQREQEQAQQEKPYGLDDEAVKATPRKRAAKKSAIKKPDTSVNQRRSAAANG